MISCRYCSPTKPTSHNTHTRLSTIGVLQRHAPPSPRGPTHTPQRFPHECIFRLPALFDGVTDQRVVIMTASVVMTALKRVIPLRCRGHGHQWCPHSLKALVECCKLCSGGYELSRGFLGIGITRLFPFQLCNVSTFCIHLLSQTMFATNNIVVCDSGYYTVSLSIKHALSNILSPRHTLSHNPTLSQHTSHNIPVVPAAARQLPCAWQQAPLQVQWPPPPQPPAASHARSA